MGLLLGHFRFTEWLLVGLGDGPVLFILTCVVGHYWAFCQAIAKHCIGPLTGPLLDLICLALSASYWALVRPIIKNGPTVGLNGPEPWFLMGLDPVLGFGPM